ncbi:MAG: site-specific integrase [Chlamydiota bacterium]
MAKGTDNIRCIRKYEKKDGSCTYHAEVRRKHAKPLRKVFTTMTAAKNWVRTTESSILEGRMPQETKARKYSVKDLIEQYKNLYLSKYPARLETQITHLQWWENRYGKKFLGDITPSLLAQAKDALLKECTPKNTLRSGPTVNRYLATLSKAFSIACKEWEWINENPFRRVSKLPEHKGRTRFLSKDELQSLLQACKAHKNPNLYGMVLMAASLGMRFGEVADLQWKHIDFENRLITLEVTKNHDVRILPMPDQIYALLKDKKGQADKEEFVFPSRDPAKRDPYSMIRKAFQSVLKELGLKDVVFHSLRHTAASHLAMGGATQGELMEVLGHRSPTMTRRYAHFNKEHIAKLLQKTNNDIIGKSEKTS